MNVQRKGLVLGVAIGVLTAMIPQAAQARGKRPEQVSAKNATPDVPKDQSAPAAVHKDGVATPSPVSTPAGPANANNTPTANGLPALSNPGGTMHE